MQPCVLRDVKRKMNAWKNSLKCTCASDAFLDLLFCFFDVFQFILYWYRYSVSTLSWRMTRRRAVLMCNTRRVQVMTDGEVMFYFNGFLRVARHTFHSIHQNRENVRMWNAKYDARSSSSIKTYDICACSTHWIAWLRGHYIFWIAKIVNYDLSFTRRFKIISYFSYWSRELEYNSSSLSNRALCKWKTKKK